MSISCGNHTIEQTLEVLTILLRHGADLSAADTVNQKKSLQLNLKCLATLILFLRQDDVQGTSALRSLAIVYTNGDEAEFLQHIQVAQCVAAVKAGDLAELRRLIEDDRIEVDGKDYVRYIVPLQCSVDESKLQLIHAARYDNLTIFEYLVEQGAIIPKLTTEGDNLSIKNVLQRRQDWVNQAVAIARRWQIPLTAIRTIHDYVIGFNWPASYEAFRNSC